MAFMQGLTRRWEDYRASKTVVFWACAACILATLIAGFGWGGWVTGGTAATMIGKASAGGRAELAATICYNRFVSAPDAAAQLASLKSSDSWKREDFIRAGGWTTIAGIAAPVDGAAALCAQQLMDAKFPPAKVAGVSG